LGKDVMVPCEISEHQSGQERECGAEFDDVEVLSDEVHASTFPPAATNAACRSASLFSCWPYPAPGSDAQMFRHFAHGIGKAPCFYVGQRAALLDLAEAPICLPESLARNQAAKQ
jgi:hypothetical protein